MPKKGKTLSYSEQAALEALLKLVKLEMIPSCPLHAVDMGRVEEQYRDAALGGYWAIKRRIVVFEWKPFKLKIPDISSGIRVTVAKTVLKLTLRGEIPLEQSGKNMQSEKEMQSKEAQNRWWPVVIEIYREEEENDGIKRINSLFKIEGEQNVRFLLYPDLREKKMFFIEKSSSK